MNYFLSKSIRWRLGFILILLNIVFHFSALQKPHSVVFDEVHFGKFLSAYCCTSKNIFDVHPPHAKLFMALGAKIGGYDGNFDFKQIGEDYKETPIFWLRFFPALFGSLIPWIFFLLLLELGLSAPAAFLGGFILTFDNALLVQSRIIILDPLLLLGLFSSLLIYFKSRSASTYLKRITLLGLSGSLAAFSVGTKFTGLVAPFLIFVLSLKEFVARPLEARSLSLSIGVQNFIRWVRQWIWISSGFLLTYLAGWWLHFKLLTQSGFGDSFFKAKGDFLQDLVQLHRVMLDRNAAISSAHSDASVWWQWPFMSTPIYYWAGDAADIYYVGNPIVWWGTTFFFVAAIAYTILSRVTQLGSPLRNSWLILAFAISYFPFAALTRPMFLYYFMMPLIFALAVVLTWLDQNGFILQGGMKNQRRSYYGLMIAVVVGFVLISPLTFGLSKNYFWTEKIFRVFPHWR